MNHRILLLAFCCISLSYAAHSQHNANSIKQYRTSHNVKIGKFKVNNKSDKTITVYLYHSDFPGKVFHSQDFVAFQSAFFQYDNKDIIIGDDWGVDVVVKGKGVADASYADFIGNRCQFANDTWTLPIAATNKPASEPAKSPVEPGKYKYNELDKLLGSSIIKTSAAFCEGRYIVIYGRNEFESQGVDKTFRDQLIKLKVVGKEFTDVLLVGDYAQCVLADGGRSWSFRGIIPDPVYNAVTGVGDRDAAIKILAYYFDYDKATSTSKNLKYVLVSDKMETNSLEIKNDIINGIKEYGNFNAAHITKDGYLLVFDKGYKSNGNVPKVLLDVLKDIDWKPTKVKFSPEGDWFIADDKGHCRFVVAHD